jgi:hypothetical protein
LAGGVATEAFHLPESVLRGDVALDDDEVVEGGCVDVGDAVGVAQDGDGRGEAGDGDGAVELGQGVAHGLVCPGSGGEEQDDDEEDRRDESDTDGSGELGGASGLGWIVGFSDRFAMEKIYVGGV